METVSLRMAFEWTCPDCGTDQFGRCIAWEGSEEERNELDGYLGIAGVIASKGGWVRTPERVTCPHCRRSFDTDDFE